MKIYLANEVLLTLYDGVIQQLAGEPDQPNQEIYVRSASIPIPIILTPECEDDKEKVIKLEKLLTDRSYSQAGQSGSEEEIEVTEAYWPVSIEFAIYTPTPNENCGICEVPISSNPKGFLRVMDIAFGELLERLKQVCGLGDIKLTVLLEDFVEIHLRSEYMNMRVTEEDIIYLSTSKSYGVEKSGFDVDSKLLEDQWKETTHIRQSNCIWEGIITIIAVLPDDWESIDLSMALKCYMMNKKILLEQVYSDATIIAKNGVGVKCHKAFLAGHSSVLATMFQTAMQESQTGTVEMPDMSEGGVRAFLAYLYNWDVKEAAKKSFIGFELFAAGHKYDISQMENSMEKILLAKNNEWYDEDVALQLFLFSRNIPNGDKLKMKAVHALKSYVT